MTAKIQIGACASLGAAPNLYMALLSLAKVYNILCTLKSFDCYHLISDKERDSPIGTMMRPLLFITEVMMLLKC